MIPMLVYDDRFPNRIDPGLLPDGVVLRIYRWHDGALLLERRAGLDEMVEDIAADDHDRAWPAGEIPGRDTHAIVLVGYDGDDGLALDRPALVTDDPELIAQFGRSN